MNITGRFINVSQVMREMNQAIIMIIIHLTTNKGQLKKAAPLNKKESKVLKIKMKTLEDRANESLD